MAAVPPQIVNIAPVPGTTQIDVNKLIRFSLRDVQTYIDLGELDVSLAYGSVLYDPTAGDLPEDVEALTDPSGTREVALETFNDWTGPVYTDASTRSFVGGKLRVAKVAGVPERSFYVVSEVIEEEQSFHVELTPDFSSAGIYAAPYFNDAGYMGVLLGVVCGPRARGVFLMFGVDGGLNPIVVVTGPATGGGGARQILATVSFDWTVDGSTYKFDWNESAGQQVVNIYVKTAALVVTQLASVPISTIASFPAAARFGGHDPQSSGRAFMIFGADGLAGSFADHSEANMLVLAGDVLTGGVQAHKGESVVVPDDQVVLDVTTLPEDADISPWMDGLATGSSGAQSTQLVITKSAAAGDSATDRAVYYREEPQLEGGPGWMLRLKLSAQEAIFLGSNHTGMGVSVDDAVKSAHLALLSDYADYFLGIQTNPAGDMHKEATFTRVPGTDWTTQTELLLIADGVRAELDVYVAGEETMPVLTLPYTAAATAPTTGSAGLTFGHLAAASLPSGSFGEFMLQALRYAAHLCAYEFHSGVLPTAYSTPWTLGSLGPGSVSVTADGLVVADTGYQGGVPGYRRYLRVEPTLQPTHGLFVEGYFKVDSWSDQIGSPDPTGEPILTGLMVDDLTDYLLLAATKAVSGRTYVYIPSVAADGGLSAVLAQTEEGEERSAEVDWTEYHTYRLERLPGHHVRLYIDNGAAPVIDLAWADRDLPFGGTVLLPTIGFASFDHTRKSQSSWKPVRYGLSRGYDLAVRRTMTQEEMLKHAFGGVLNVILKATDVDP